MGIFSPQVVIIAISTLLHIIWNYVLVIQFGLGVHGTAYATSITYITNFVLLTSYLWYS